MTRDQLYAEIGYQLYTFHHHAMPRSKTSSRKWQDALIKMVDEYVAWVIGEDEEVYIPGGGGFVDLSLRERNDLRAQQRARAGLTQPSDREEVSDA